jgi:hypothetical protein
MRNDARPIGEALRDVQKPNRERGSAERRAERRQQTGERKPFVTDRDTGDEEMPRRQDSRVNTKM